jgi:hypothetical protein
MPARRSGKIVDALRARRCRPRNAHYGNAVSKRLAAERGAIGDDHRLVIDARKRSQFARTSATGAISATWAHSDGDAIKPRRHCAGAGDHQFMGATKLFAGILAGLILAAAEQVGNRRTAMPGQPRVALKTEINRVMKAAT